MGPGQAVRLAVDSGQGMTRGLCLLGAFHMSGEQPLELVSSRPVSWDRPGLNRAIDQLADKAEKIIQNRLKEFQAGFEQNLARDQELVEATRL